MTPGPWTVHKGGGGHRRSHVIVRGDQIVAWMEGLNNNDCGLDLDDNARLIAAAPDMLSALVDLVYSADRRWRRGDTALVRSITNARAVIAKATNGDTKS
jgi:hypothetical protein